MINQNQFSKLWLVILLMLISHLGFAQQNRKIVKQHNADLFKYIKEDGGIFELRGNVVLEHNEWFIYCDLAYLNKTKNYFDAYFNVKIVKRDSLQIFGDTLHYIGNLDLAKIRGDVIVLNDSLTLTTNHLDYNTDKSIGNYFNRGKLVNEENVLESVFGEFHTREDLYVFHDSVVLYNSEYVMYTDSLRHYSEQELSYFFGKTKMFGDDKEVYCNKGWYNSKRKQGNAEIGVEMFGEGKELYAEYVFFDDSLGYNNARNQVELIDSSQNLVVRGNYIDYFKDPEKIVVTDEALLIQASEPDDSLYLHADTLLILTHKLNDSLKQVLVKKQLADSASIAQDTVFREFFAYYGVRFYKSNLQGKCDSMFVSSLDSTIYMHTNPVLWSDINQLSSDSIIVHTKNQKVTKVDFLNSAFIIAEDTIDKFNQVKGKNMYAYVKKDKLNYVEVRTSGETKYYIKEKNDYTGMYDTQSANIDIYFDEEGKIDKIVFKKDPKTVMIPIDKIEEEQKKLKKFNWQVEIRPKSKEDVMIKK